MRPPAALTLAAAICLLTLQAQQPAASVDPPADARLLLEARGEGVQIYTCDGTKWVLKAPDARLVDASGKVVGSHFAGPTWKLMDGGQVQGQLLASQPAPDPGSVAWLLLRAKPGTAAGSLATVAFIRRTQTRGGAAAVTGCENASDTGKTQQVPYTANYTFYTQQ